MELLSVPGLCWTWGHAETAPWGFWTRVPCGAPLGHGAHTACHLGRAVQHSSPCPELGKVQAPHLPQPLQAQMRGSPQPSPPGREPPTPACLPWVEPGGLWPQRAHQRERFPSRAGAKEEGERPSGSPQPRVLFTHLGPSGLLEGRGRAGWDRGCGVPLTSERRPGGWAGLTSGGLGAPGAQISGLWGGRVGLGLGSTRCDQFGPGGHS